jgi:hypothetical protein
MKLFNKIGRNATKFFNKVGSDAVKIGTKLSTGASDALRGISKGADALSNNAILNQIGGDSAKGFLSNVSTLARDGSNLVNYKKYNGGFNKVSRQILEKAQKIEDDGAKFV